MVFDCFLFNNEFQLLKLRLNYLRDIVDKFIIVESDMTFSGKKKSLHIADIVKNNLSIDLPYDKIVTYKVPYIEFKGDRWAIEFHSRNFMKQALIDNSIEDDDYVIISDVDEIPRREAIEARKSGVLEMDSYHFYLNHKERNIFWYGSIVDNWEGVKRHNIQDLRNVRRGFNHIPNGGWHFTYMGGTDAIRRKLADNSHSELDDDFWVEQMIKQVDSSRFERVWMTKDTHPDYLIDNMEQFLNLIL